MQHMYYVPARHQHYIGLRIQTSFYLQETCVVED